MRLFIKWRFYFVLFEVVTVINQMWSIKASKYHDPCMRDPRPFLPASAANPASEEETWHLLSER